MKLTKLIRASCVAVLLAAAGGVFAVAAARQDEEPEKKITEAQVPAAALQAFKKLAGAAAITEFVEETEHGSTFYEASWIGPNGNVDCLVTAAGDLVELGESTPANAAPASVRSAAGMAAGADALLAFEKKTVVFYEVQFKKDGKSHEVAFMPDGRRCDADEDEDEDEAGDVDNNGDDGEGDDDDDDDDDDEDEDEDDDD